MPGLNERRKFLKTKVPDAVDTTLGDVLAMPTSKLAKTVGNASLVLVRSQEIDFAGESDGSLLARQVMETVIGNLARAVRKLAAAGIALFQPRVRIGAQRDDPAGEFQACQVSGAIRRRLAGRVIAPVRLANPGQGVEGRESASLIVRIGWPGFDQLDGQLEVAIQDRQD